RAIRWDAFEALAMEDRNFGWTAEMQVKVLRHGMRVEEVPVSYRKRIGISKITGTVKGTILAGYKILWTVFRYSWGR
ncbi:MAG: glycosyltransferase family 2 protein, partial [Acidobacteriota bacterium]